MKKWLFLLGAGAVLLCLCGCDGLSERNARMEDLALLRVLAVDAGTGGVSVSATTGRTQQQPTVFLHGKGETVSAACLLARGGGDAYPTYSHVEQILIGEDLARQGLAELLDYLERDVELRLSSRLWLLRGAACDALTEEQAEEVVERLAALEEMTGVGANGPERTAGDLIAAQDRSGYGFLPALTLTEEGELTSSGYGVLKDHTLLCWLEGDCAMGANLILGAMDDGVVELSLSDGGRASVRIGGTSSQVRGLFEDGTLTGLQVSCQLQGSAALLPTGWRWTEEEKRELEEKTAQWAEDCIRQSVAMMQSMDADPLELGRRAGLSEPWRWNGLSGQWESAFSGLDVHVEVTASVER